jgi:hypothetical protein
MVSYEVGNRRVRGFGDSNPSRQDRIHHGVIPNRRHELLAFILVTDDFFALFHTLFGYKFHGRVFVFRLYSPFGANSSRQGPVLSPNSDSSWHFAPEKVNIPTSLRSLAYSRRKKVQNVISHGRKFMNYIYHINIRDNLCFWCIILKIIPVKFYGPK